MTASFVAILVSLAGGVSSAGAAFPGRNGAIAFASDDFDRGGTGSIVTVSPSGRHRRKVYEESFGGSGQLAPRFSPDGKLIAFETNGQTFESPGGSSVPQGVVVMSSDGSHQRFLTAGGAPTWAPDGRTLVYVNGGKLFTIGVDGSGNRQLTDSAVYPSAWSSRGLIAYEQRDGIYAIPAGGGRAGRIARRGEAPDFSPRGRQIVFDRRVGQTMQVFVMGSDGRNVRQITRLRNSNRSAVFSPDGRWIAFIHSQSYPDTGGGGGQVLRDRLWTVRVDGSRAHQVAEEPSNTGFVNVENPSWQPIP